LREELRLLLLILLHRLHLQDLHLHHLHLQRVHGLGGLDRLVGQERRCKGSDIRIHAALLLVGEPVVWPVDGGGHGHAVCLVVGEDGLGRHVDDLIVIFLGEDGGMKLGSKARDVEGPAWCGGVRDGG